MRVIRTLIAEDEAPARQWLRALCAKHRDVQIIGECASVSETTQRLRTTAVDLLLLDIHLGPHHGFRVLDGVSHGAVPLVIVVTAYDRYAVNAFEKHAVDYLLKPVREERFAMALDRARRRLQAGLTTEMRAELQAALRPLQELFLKGQTSPLAPRLIAEREGALHVLDATDVELVESDGNYVTLLALGASYTARSTMQSMEETLPPQLFVRLSRSAIVNVTFVARIERVGDSDYAFVTKSGRHLKVGRSFRPTVSEMIRTQQLRNPKI
jgi:two-component system LytT family response regulator